MIKWRGSVLFLSGATHSLPNCNRFFKSTFLLDELASFFLRTAKLAQAFSDSLHTSRESVLETFQKTNPTTIKPFLDNERIGKKKKKKNCYMTKEACWSFRTENLSICILRDSKGYKVNLCDPQ